MEPLDYEPRQKEELPRKKWILEYATLVPRLALCNMVGFVLLVFCKLSFGNDFLSDASCQRLWVILGFPVFDLLAKFPALTALRGRSPFITSLDAIIWIANGVAWGCTI